MSKLRWTKHDDALLIRLDSDGKTRKQIAKIMGIKTQRVNCRMYVLGIPSQRDRTPKLVTAMLAAGYPVKQVALTFDIATTYVRKIQAKARESRRVM